MKQELSIDLLKRLKLNNYTLLISKPGNTFQIEKTFVPVEMDISSDDLLAHEKLDKQKLGIPPDREVLIIDLLLAQDPPDNRLSGSVELPDDSLASEL